MFTIRSATNNPLGVIATCVPARHAAFAFTAYPQRLCYPAQLASTDEIHVMWLINWEETRAEIGSALLGRETLACKMNFSFSSHPLTVLPIAILFCCCAFIGHYRHALKMGRGMILPFELARVYVDN